MSCAKDHKFWKEFVNRNDKKFGGWGRTNQEKAEQGCLMFQKPIRIMLYGILPHSKMIKTVPVVADGSGGDYGRGRRQSLLKNEKTKPTRPPPREKQICKRCQMEEYQKPYPNGGDGGGGGKCSKCKETVSYHSFRCCTCGIEPLDPRLVLWEEEGGPKDDGGEYVIEEGGYWDDFY